MKTLPLTFLFSFLLSTPIFAQSTETQEVGTETQEVGGSISATLGSDDSQTRHNELAEKYEGIKEGSTRPENLKIICPFHRLLERAGLYDEFKPEDGPIKVGFNKIAYIAKEFGCSYVSCGGVAALVSLGQTAQLASVPGFVNLEALHKAFGISHECGLTFAKGGTEVSEEVRALTLLTLKNKMDKEGRLKLEDLQTVKEGICSRQRVKNDTAGKTEVKLIYGFLGGNERGYIDYADLERFFHAELPKVLGNP